MSDEPVEATGATFRLMYRSRDHLPPEDREDELGDLFVRARSNNEKRNITGALLLSGHWFVQVLEGDEADVRSLFTRIQEDPRHNSVELLFAGRAHDRIFAHWSMAKVAMPDSDLPLIAQISEISPASSRGMTPAQNRLLDVMRDAIGDASIA
jgi:hypothetical protein